MVALWELPATVLLALIAANLEPLVQCSDGRWRSCPRGFPSEGVSVEDIDELERDRLIECWPSGAVVTERGRKMLSSMRGTGEQLQTPARLAERDAHPSLQ